jgi:hypothetical protein
VYERVDIQLVNAEDRPTKMEYQWSWDSAFIAMGSIHYDQTRAEQELRTLFKGQWSNGMLPHMVFDPQASNYQDRLQFWQVERYPYAPRDRQTSGIVQPPVHATAILHIYRHAQDISQARTFLAEMFPHLKAREEDSFLSSTHGNRWITHRFGTLFSSAYSFDLKRSRCMSVWIFSW